MLYIVAIVPSVYHCCEQMQVLLGKSRCTERVDIYSYGVVLWELCTGAAPEGRKLRSLRVPEECPQVCKLADCSLSPGNVTACVHVHARQACFYYVVLLV